MSTLFTTVILAMALMTPNLAVPLPKLPDVERTAPEGQCPGCAVPLIADTIGSVTPDRIFLQAPKTAFLSLDEYAAQAAREAGIDPVQFKRLIACESRWKEDAAGDNGTSLGLLQFKKPTFALFSRKYFIPDADMDNSHHQIDLAAGMIADGYLHHWKNCSHKIGWSVPLPILRDVEMHGTRSVDTAFRGPAADVE